MLPTRPSASLTSLLRRPFTRVNPHTSLSLSSRRLYASGYGDGKGDPKGENPEKQGSNPSADLEHPGPPPVAEGQGTGSSPTKGSSKGHSSKPSSSPSSSASKSTSSDSSSSRTGAQPKIHDERDGPAAFGTNQEDVDQHNREFENRHGRAQARDDGKDKVPKEFWKGKPLEPGLTLI